jgi:hypothetical protein
MNVVDVIDVGDVRNIGNISDVGDVDLTQIDVAVVIPGVVRLAGTEWKPCRYPASGKADGKS